MFYGYTLIWEWKWKHSIRCIKSHTHTHLLNQNFMCIKSSFGDSDNHLDSEPLTGKKWLKKCRFLVNINKSSLIYTFSLGYVDEIASTSLMVTCPSNYILKIVIYFNVKFSRTLWIFSLLATLLHKYNLVTSVAFSECM